MTSNSNMPDEEKNWNDLPAGIKMECIKRMNFLTRWALHYTSHAEKELVESTKSDGELLIIDSWDIRFLRCSSSNFHFKFEHENLDTLESLLRMAKFEYLRIDCNRPSFKNILEISSKIACSVKDLCLFEPSKENLEIVRHCRGLRSLGIYSRDRDKITLRELLNIHEVIANTKRVILKNFGSPKPEDVIQLVEKWIADDKEMGSCIKIEWNQSSSEEVAILEGLKNAFGERFQIPDDEKNWNDLPAEMKLECIKRMDFKTRWALHHTSHTEKELVESTKWDGDLNETQMNNGGRFVIASSSSNFRFKLEQENVVALESVLRMTKFKRSFIDCSRPSFQNLFEMFSRIPFYIRYFVLYQPRKDDLEILKNFRGLETLEIQSLFGDNITLRELLNDYEILVNTKYVYFLNFGSIESEDVIQLIEKWIANDKQLGSDFDICCESSSEEEVDILEGLKNAFAGRFQVIELDEQEVYISFKEDKYIQVRVSRFGSAYLKVVDKLPI